MSILTNQQNGSVHTAKTKVITFNELWNSYPDDDPCSDEFTNQCAIRISQALFDLGIQMKSFRGVRCWHDHQPEHVLRAQELANWFKKKPFAGCGDTETYTGANFVEKLDGKTGVIFLADYWQRRGETGDNRSGDHIDLWNGSRMTNFSSYFRAQFGLSLDGYWSDYRLAKEVLFWEIK
ncbi:MAG: type VI secretion system amidase effector protein Tae4 [Amphritea sp.]|nr:type VI secretion system amidase effector protein Tae4 [Amphritea sp.]